MRSWSAMAAGRSREGRAGVVSNYGVGLGLLNILFEKSNCNFDLKSRFEIN